MRRRLCGITQWASGFRLWAHSREDKITTEVTEVTEIIFNNLNFC